MRAVFMGTPAYAVPVLEGLEKSDQLEIVGVYTPPDRPRGRGQALEASPVKPAALDAGLPVFQPASLRSRQVQEELADLRPDVAVVAAYGKLLPPAVLELPRHGCLNIHPSLLPRYRGPSPVVTTLLDGVATTGVTLMLLDEGMDTGPILAQRTVELRGDETAGGLTAELFKRGGELLLDTLPAWTSGRLDAMSQDNEVATVTRKIERNDGLADWSKSAADLERRWRAFTPWPGIFTHWEGKVLRLTEVTAVTQPATGSLEAGSPETEPGLVLALTSAEAPLGIATASGVLGLKSVQLEGRRNVTAAEFLRGYPHFPGCRL